MSLVLKQQKTLLNLFFISLIVGLFSHLVFIFFLTDPKLQLGGIFIDSILIGLFLMALLRLDYAFIASLLLLPVFFLLENLSTLSHVYRSQTSFGFSFYTVDPRTIGFILAFAFTILMMFKQKVSFFKAPLSKIIPLVFSYFCLSAFWSVGGTEKYVQISFYLLLSSLFFITYFSIRNQTSFYRLIFFIIFLSLPAILLSYYQLFGGIFYEYADLEIKRVSGPFDSPNLLGSLLLVTSALSLILLLVFRTLKKKKYQYSLLTYLIFTFPIFILTFSRSAWLGLLVFLSIFSLQKKRFFIGALLSFSLLLSIMLIFEPTRNRISGFSERRMFDSIYARTNIWYLSGKKFREKPIFGYGAGSFAEVINDAKESAGGTENPHNDLVFFSVEGGIIGLIGFLSIISTFYYYLVTLHWKIKRNLSHNSKERQAQQLLSLGIISLFVAVTIISMVESYYEGNFFHLFVWALLAGWLALAKKNTSDKNNQLI